jgi:hypothetical protein
MVRIEEEKRLRLFSGAPFAEEATEITSLKCLEYEMIGNVWWPSQVWLQLLC